MATAALHRHAADVGVLAGVAHLAQDEERPVLGDVDRDLRLLARIARRAAPRWRAPSPWWCGRAPARRRSAAPTPCPGGRRCRAATGSGGRRRRCAGGRRCRADRARPRLRHRAAATTPPPAPSSAPSRARRRRRRRRRRPAHGHHRAPRTGSSSHPPSAGAERQRRGATPAKLLEFAEHGTAGLRQEWPMSVVLGLPG